MSKYKVGDKVLIEAEIKENARAGAYKIDMLLGIRNLWINENDIQGKAKTYEEGLNDAWELAKKITLNAEDDFSCDQVEEIFGRDSFCVLGELTPQEALAKIEAYEESKAIKVGDVVYADDEPGSFGVVTWKYNNGIYVMWDDGSCGDETNIEELHKTGRHIDIEHLLEQIRGNE